MHSFQSKNNFHFSVLGFLIALTVIRILLLFVCDLPLYSDEAQYWIWSKNPDWGYYSKPPVIAWIIALSTGLFGDAEAYVRLGAPILHFCTAITLYFIGKELSSRVLGIYSAIIYSTLPSVFLSSLIISTDAPLLLIWALALLQLVKIIRRDNIRNWVYLGLFVGLGMLTKYHMAMFGLCGLIFIILANRLDLLKNWKLYGAMLIALLIWTPNIVWNLNNYLASFNHMVDLAQGQAHNKFSFKSLFNFLLAQFGVFGPILIILFMYICVNYKRFIKPDNISKLLFSFSLPILGMFCGIAFFSRSHANWSAPAYIAATLLVSHQITTYNLRKVFYSSMLLHIFAGSVFIIYTLALAYFPVTLSSYNDPFRRLRGSKELAQQFLYYKTLFPNAVFACDDRQYYALFVYYNRPHMFGLKKWSVNKHRIKDHFDLKNSLGSASNIKSQDIILVSDFLTMERLINYAESVENIGILQYHLYHGLDKSLKVFHLKNFKGF